MVELDVAAGVEASHLTADPEAVRVSGARGWMPRLAGVPAWWQATHGAVWSKHAKSDEPRWALRRGGGAAVLGALLGMVGNLIHPVGIRSRAGHETHAAAVARFAARSASRLAAWDALLRSARVLLDHGMPAAEVGKVLMTEDPETIRRHMELHRERLQERLADEVATVGRIQASMNEVIRARTRARSVITLVAGDETPEPDQVGA